MTLRPCIDCGTLTRAARCTTHERVRDRQRGTARQRGYGAEHRRLRAEAIAAQPWCSRCLTTGSSANPLTADHDQALARGGATEASNIVVLCRDCNSAKKDRPS